MVRKKIKKLILPIVFSVFFASAVIASVEPNAVVIFYLPVQNTAEVNSSHESVYKPVKKGVVIAETTENLPKPDKISEKYGIVTPIGVSLYDKGKTPLAEAENNVLSPAKVMILPPEAVPENVKSVPGTPDSVVPLPIRIFPLTFPQKQIQEEEKARPVETVLKPNLPPPAKGKRPADEKEWTTWILEQLNTCEGNVYEALPTLYWIMTNHKLTDGKTDCDMKDAVAGYLRQCHPWPVVYYTPVNADVPVRPLTQMAAEVLETSFDTPFCRKLDLTKINFEKVEFIKGNLKQADFSHSYFDGAFFSDTDLSEAVFQGAMLDNVLIQGGSLSKAYLKKARLRNSHVLDADANMTYFDGADLVNTQFRRTDMSFSSLKDAKLANTAWEDVKAYHLAAENADFTKSAFNNVLFEQMKAPDADFSKIFCKDCVFQSADLKNTQFYKAVLDNASFVRADLNGAYFKEAVFKNAVFMQEAKLYQTNFGGSDLSLFSGVPVETLRLTVIDETTVMPKEAPDFEAASYDVEIFNDNLKKGKWDKWSCTAKMCSDRLLGRVSNTNLAVRAMSLLDSPLSSEEDKLWSLCTMGCIANHDKKLEPSQTDIIAAYVKRQSPWSADDLFKPFKPVSAPVQMALYILTNPENQNDLGYDINLSRTDLRGADLSNGDLRNINLAGANLGGANLKNSKVDKTFSHFDQVVIDQYTVLPKQMGDFMPYRLPDSIWPRWWKPETVTVYKNNINLWSATVEDIPFSDDFIFPPIQKKADTKEK